MKLRKRILVAPLNWGLGHSTRCIPIIQALIDQGFDPVIASDGVALELLKKEFPSLIHEELPSYNITYSKKGIFFKYKILKDAPRILRTQKEELQKVKELVKTYDIVGIISDNRFGVRHKNIPSIFITHQLQVLSGATTWFSTRFHHNVIKKFDECWVPDAQGKVNLSGKLGHLDHPIIPTKYLGPISRFNKQDLEIIYDLMVLLSGPEPQRTMLQEKLLTELSNYNGKVLFVRGVIESKQLVEKKENITIYNFMTSNELETALNQSAIVVSRSGYTTVLDLAKLGKKAFFIPTPGQTEQEYLAIELQKQGLVPTCKQSQFKIKDLERVKDFKGLSFETETNFESLFSLF